MKRFHSTILAVLAIALASTPARLQAESADTKAADHELVEFLRSYIRIDTSNPPGNETAAAQFLAERFRKEGIEAEVLESKPGRGIVLARLRGTGEARPIVLLNHLDVVPAVAEEWSQAPFAAVVQDGYVYGRGAIDCKGPAVVEATALISLKRAGVKLARDVIFLGTADEEVGGEWGAGWFAENKLDELANAEFVLNEGGFINTEEGRRVYEVSALEKTPCWLKLTTSGQAGHGSTPPDDTAPKRLVQALSRVVAYEPPISVLPEVQEYFAAMARFETGSRAAAYKDLRKALEDADFRAEFLRDPASAALVRNTIAPTVLSGSHKTNVIPQQASAEIDCRLLPGVEPADFVRTMEDVIDDKAVRVDVILNFPPSASSIDTRLFEAIRRVGEREGAVVVPKMLRGFTDSHFFRTKGITSYGFVPLEVGSDDDKRMHGVDERVSIASLGDGARRLVEILKTLDEIDRKAW